MCGCFALFFDPPHVALRLGLPEAEAHWQPAGPGDQMGVISHVQELRERLRFTSMWNRRVSARVGRGWSALESRLVEV